MPTGNLDADDFPSLRSRDRYRIKDHTGSVPSSFPLLPLALSLFPSYLRLFFALPLAFLSALHSLNKSLNESPLTLNYHYLSLYRLTFV